MSIEAGLVLKADPITIDELIEAMKNMPKGTTVERISRDERECLMGVGLESAHFEAEPVVEIRLLLPKTTRSRTY